MIRRVLAFLLSLALMAAFYVFSVMMEGLQDARTGEFQVRADASGLSRKDPLESTDARALARAFGAALPVPGGLGAGLVSDGSHHGYLTRQVTLQGARARVTGVRPASAAPSILPGDLVFLASGEALVGYRLLRAERDGEVFYAMVAGDAAFLITPLQPPDPGGFTLAEP